MEFERELQKDISDAIWKNIKDKVTFGDTVFEWEIKINYIQKNNQIKTIEIEEGNL